MSLSRKRSMTMKSTFSSTHDFDSVPLPGRPRRSASAQASDSVLPDIPEWRSTPRWRGRRPFGLFPSHDVERQKAAIDQPRSVERDFPGYVQRVVFVHSRLGCIEGLLVRPDLPREHDSFALL